VLLTQDNVQLGVVDLSSNEYQMNDLLKFQVSGMIFDNSSGVPKLVNPVYVGKCNKSRAAAHSIARIMFHHGSNIVNVPTIQTLVQVSKNPTVVDGFSFSSMEEDAGENEEYDDLDIQMDKQ
jgi:hypothetical protein